MKVLLLGATGLVGRALALRLARDGHQVSALVRKLDAARGLLGGDVELIAMRPGDDALRDAVAGCDAVVNLAGAPIARRWSARVRAEAIASRVDLNRALARAVAACDPRPRVLVAASAVGIYGDRGDEVLDEDATLGEGWLAQVCRDWEAAARESEAHGVRVACVRIGVVLASDGGALAALLPTTRLGLGAVLGSGRQFMPWIELLDLVELLATAMVDERYTGAINATAPTPVRNRELVRALARALGRPQLFRVPGFFLRLALGEAAQIVLHGQRVVPTRALALGFRFRHEQLATALHELVQGRVALDIARVVDRRPSSAYLDERPPRWRLETSIRLAAPVDQVVAFFGRTQNLGAMTPLGMGFAILGEPPDQVREGTTIDYRVKVGRLALRWRTRIDRVDERGFADSQLRGPYRAWYHEHEFIADGDGTVMTDRVWYALPFGPLGAIAHPLFVAPQLRRIFQHRTRCAVLRFGDGGAARVDPVPTRASE
jgi:uncharacterized protein